MIQHITTNTDFPGWPSGDYKSILELSPLLSDIAQKKNLQVTSAEDELGPFLGAHVVDEILGPIVFIQYLQSPQKHTHVWVDKNVETKRAIPRIIQWLAIPSRAIAWPRLPIRRRNKLGGLQELFKKYGLPSVAENSIRQMAVESLFSELKKPGVAAVSMPGYKVYVLKKGKRLHQANPQALLVEIVPHKAARPPTARKPARSKRSLSDEKMKA